MDRRQGLRAVLWLVGAVACRTGRPLYDSTPGNENARGTIAGSVTAGGEALPGRQVRAVRLGTTETYAAVTSVTGGFSIQVPPGRYRLEVTLAEGERIVRQPSVVNINESDLDANLEIMVAQ
ncbi:MAG TPA: carboxypeptidase-like regulatory domain-containing protein [Vicinamibacteria bacterium]|nr:carboxypeptidase-like regulatory domain-containing protein [Vicinamibacteria bacterium]